MNLVRRLNRETGKTIVLVVHDLNLAARYADVIFAMRDGKIVASGEPADVFTAEIVRSVFGVEARIVHGETDHLLLCVPNKTAG
jgi:iron complex transport system ATP-binding protein